MYTQDCWASEAIFIIFIRFLIDIAQLILLASLKSYNRSILKRHHQSQASIWKHWISNYQLFTTTDQFLQCLIQITFRCLLQYATGFLMYSVFDAEVILGAFKRNSPSHSCCSNVLSVVLDGRVKR